MMFDQETKPAQSRERIRQIEFEAMLRLATDPELQSLFGEISEET